MLVTRDQARLTKARNEDKLGTTGFGETIRRLGDGSLAQPPPITRTTHILHFDALSPHDFERLCLWLVEREGYERAEHLGAAGSERGRDITAWREAALWAFQCKRVQRFGPRDALVEIEKLLALPDAERPAGLVFLVTCNVSFKTRQQARARCAREMECHFWAGTELDAKVKRHPGIVQEFFQATPSPTPACDSRMAVSTRVSHWLMPRLISYTPLFHPYLQEYRERLASELRVFNLLGRDTPLDLERIYITLRLSRHARPDLLPDPRRTELRSLGRDPRRARRRGEAMEVEAALGRSSRLIVLGHPGAGKTTLLKHLALRAARGDPKLARVITESYQPGRLTAPPIPVLLTLNDLAQGGNSIVEGIVAAFARHGFPDPSIFVDRALARGWCLLLLDGLDEVASKRLRYHLVEEIDKLAADHRGNTLVVTSRIHGFDYFFRSDFTLLEVVDFDWEQIRCFLESWFADMPERAEDLMSVLAEKPRIRLLAANPLLLSIIALIYEQDLRLPERRVELYERCVWVLLEEWERLKGRAGERQFAPDVTLRALEELALRFHQGECIAMDRDQLLTHLREILPQASAFLDEVLDRTGLLRQMSHNSYAFTHLTLQEFLAACAIRQDIRQTGDYSPVLDRLDDSWWRETIILLAGIERDATLLIRGILAARPRSREVLLLAVRCLTDADETETQLRADVARRVVRWLKKTDDYRLVQGVEDLAYALDEAAWADLTNGLRAPGPSGRVRIAGLLGAIGAERGVPPLVEAAMSDKVAKVRIAAGDALGAIGSDVAIKRLSAVLHDGSEPPKVRIAAAEALGRISLDAVDKKVCRVLTAFLTDRNSDVRREASKALRFAFAFIPAGEFLMGAEKLDQDAKDDEKPKHRVDLDAYYIARYPVTEAQYHSFAEATGHRPSDHWTGNYPPEGKEGLPVVQVSWRDAVAYCKWLAGELRLPIRLPTEAEWEKAASWDARVAGAGQPNGWKRRWPWGNNDVGNQGRAVSPGMGMTVKEYSPMSVGAYSPAEDSPYGVADMAGNVWQWCSTVLKAYPYKAHDGREDLDASGPRVLRGGSIYYGVVPCTVRSWDEPDRCDWFYGFRVAWSPT
jgi:formylglycine-generating enzyme required for sulfatase activity